MWMNQPLALAGLMLVWGAAVDENAVKPVSVKVVDDTGKTKGKADKIPPELRLKDIDPVATALNPVPEKPVAVSALHNVTYAASGEILATGSGTGHIYLWSLDTGGVFKYFKAHEDWSFSVVFAADQKMIYSGGGDNLIKVWNLDQLPEPVAILDAHTDDVHAVALTSTGKKLISAGDDRQLIVWDLASEEPLHHLTGHDKQVTALSLHPGDTMVASASRDHTVRLWDVETGRALRTLQGHQQDVMSVRFSPDGKYLASGGYDSTVRIWNVDSGEQVQVDRRHPGAVVSLAFAPNGLSVASVDHQNVLVTPLTGSSEASRSTKFKIEAMEQLSFVAFSPDGRELAVTTTSGKVHRLDSRTLKVLSTMPK